MMTPASNKDFRFNIQKVLFGMSSLGIALRSYLVQLSGLVRHLMKRLLCDMLILILMAWLKMLLIYLDQSSES